MSFRGRFEALADMTAEQKYQEMTEKPVGPLILAMAWPAILSNLVSVLYSLSDTFFVGRLGTPASAAIGISFVAMTAIQAVGFFFGQGTGNAIARHLGAGDQKAASTMASTGVVCTVVAGLLIAVLGNVFLEPLCLLAGSTPTVMPYAKPFISIILCGAPWMCTSLMLSMQLRFEGESFFSMLAVMTGTILNIFLSPFFIFICHMGIAGSALANIVCQFVSLVLLVKETQKLGIAPLSWRHVRFSGAMLHEIGNGGFPSFARQCMLAVATTLMNHAAAPFGDAAIAAMAVVQRIASIGAYVQIGIGQGYQPVLGYNLGAKRFERARAGYFFSLKAACLSVFAIGIFTCIFAPELIGFFRDDPHVIAIGTLTLRLQSFTMMCAGVSMITNFMLQTSGHMWAATILGTCRMGLVLGPVVIVLTHTLGLLGLQIAQPVATLITSVLAIPFARFCLKGFTKDEAVEEAPAVQAKAVPAPAPSGTAETADGTEGGEARAETDAVPQTKA